MDGHSFPEGCDLFRKAVPYLNLSFAVHTKDLWLALASLWTSSSFSLWVSLTGERPAQENFIGVVLPIPLNSLGR
jgi:hypothetical protein